MERRSFLKRLGFGTAALALPSSYMRLIYNPVNRPNIILFLVDDLGWQDSSEPFYRERTPFNERYRTPNMERLAREGVKFTQAYACAVCSPTRVSLLTGMNAARHRVTNWTLQKNTSTDAEDEVLELPQWNVNGLTPVPDVERAVYATPLPALLRENGYFTIHCGKAHFGAQNTPGANPLNLGFDVNIAGHAAGAPGSYDGLKNFGNRGDEQTLPWGVPGLQKYHGKDISLTEALTIEACAAVERARQRQRPFFLYMSHYAVHTPLEADRRFIRKYQDAQLDPKETAYASMIEAMDRSLGVLMTMLREKGLEENTIILFMSDNGGLSAVGRGGTPHTHNKPLASGKGSAYEGGIREPMIVKWPGVTQPKSLCHQYVIIEDFFPTILEMAGIRDYRAVQTIDGLSFVPLLARSGTYPVKRPLFWHFPNNWGPKGPGIGASSTVRKGDWKLIYFHAEQRFELFNLVNDIGETANLSKQHTERVRELALLLDQHLRAVRAQMPLNKSTGHMIPYPMDALDRLQE